MPGSFLDNMVFSGASESYVRAFEEKWGLNDPLYVQYINYLWNFLHFDVGESLQYKTPVWDHVKMKLFNTLILAVPGITTAYILGSVFGTVVGNIRDSLAERGTVIGLITIGAFPEFFLAIVFIFVFSTVLGVLPSSGMISPELLREYADAPWYRPYLSVDFLAHYILPFAVIVSRGLMVPTLIMRTSVVEVSGQDFIDYHDATGLPYWKQLRHIGKHSILPVLTVYPISMTRAISGLVLIELVFNWPGIGLALVNAVLARDFPVVQFVFFLTAAFVILANFVIDIFYGVIDPRIDVQS
jgi:peptide/nickel transport system permease protein